MNDRPFENDKKRPALDGIRVVEYGVYHAGRGATAILGDLGADVIKIEQGDGDPERFWTRMGDLDTALSNGQGIWFQISNRNKKAIYLDIKKKKGRDVFHRLIEEADVFLTNLRKSTKKKMDLDYKSISRINPRIVYASVSGYGPEGPASDIGAFDPLGQARTGMMYATGAEEPYMINFGVLDQSTAIAASHGILTALLARERQGIGQEIHVSLLSTGMWLMYANMMMIAGLKKDPNIQWSRLKHSPLRNRFRCKDGKWIIGTHHPESRYWSVFCKITGQEKLLEDPRFLDDASRQANCQELIPIFDKVFATKTSAEWMEIFQANGLMFSSVQRNIELFDDPQALLNNYFVDYDHPLIGKLKIPGYPIHFSGSSQGRYSPAPDLGEHTDEIMRQMRYSDKEIEDLKKEEVIR